MKGIVFTEFLEMAEERFSLSVVDAVLERAAPASGGIYTAVGTYPAGELVGLLMELAQQTNIPASNLLKEFGGHLLRRFVQTQPEFFSDARSTLKLLQSVEGYIHVEVKKLYPDAELPSFECHSEGEGKLTMIYRSPRGLADLAEGLMAECALHYGERVSIAREDLSGGKGQHVRFSLVLLADSEHRLS
jgi:hypothetical protein